MYRFAFIALLFVGSATAQEKSADTTVELPDIAPAPTPPQPSPTTLITLPADTLYVFTSAKPCLVVTSPDGVCAVEQEAGPIKIHSKFAGGNGKIETRNYTRPYVYSVKGVADGRCELIIAEEGARTLLRRTIVAGIGPLPPPNPGPTPPPTPTPATGPMYVVVVEETAEAVAERGMMFVNPALNSYMASKKHKWRIVDKDVRTADGQPPADVARFLEAAKGKRYPQVFIVDSKGATIIATDLPKTPAELLALLQRAGG
jgi:hypothetical protein